MPIEFKTPDPIEKQLQQAQVIAENVMRPESRVLDDHEHLRPVKFVHMLWPQMQQVEKVNLEAALARARNGAGGEADRQTGRQGGPEGTPEMGNIANLTLVHLIEMLSWGDA